MYFSSYMGKLVKRKQYKKCLIGLDIYVCLKTVTFLLLFGKRQKVLKMTEWDIYMNIPKQSKALKYLFQSILS